MKLTKLTKEDFAKQLTVGFDRRIFITGHLTDYIPHLNEMEAFALSRLLPKPILERLLQERVASPFMDKIVDFHNKISKNGPIDELKATKDAEETFLSAKATEMLNVLLNR